MKARIVFILVIVIFSAYLFSNNSSVGKQIKSRPSVLTKRQPEGKPQTIITVPGSVAQPIAFTIRPTDKPYSVFCYFSGDVSNNAVVTITDVTQLPGTVVTTFNYLPYAQGYTLPVPIAGTPAHTYNVSTTFDNLASPTVSYDNVDNEGAGISNLSCNGGMVRCEYSKFVMGAGYSVLVTVVDQTIYNN